MTWPRRAGRMARSTRCSVGASSPERGRDRFVQSGASSQSGLETAERCQMPLGHAQSIKTGTIIATGRMRSEYRMRSPRSPVTPNSARNRATQTLGAAEASLRLDTTSRCVRIMEGCGRTRATELEGVRKWATSHAVLARRLRCDRCQVDSWSNERGCLSRLSRLGRPHSKVSAEFGSTWTSLATERAFNTNNRPHAPQLPIR